MDKQSKKQINQQLLSVTNLLIDWLDQQAREDFNKELVMGKWTTAQHVDHLIRSTKPLNQALKMPRLALRAAFGKNNRTEKTYQSLFEKYKEKLAAGGQASGRFIPPTTKFNKKETVHQLRKELTKLAKSIDGWKEEDLGKYLLPHPLLGKLTVREMLYFAIIHTEHHYLALKNGY